MSSIAPFQNTMLTYSASHQQAALFATMGARKTSTTIIHAIRMGFKKVLVVCLKNNIKTWCDELDDRFHGEGYQPILGSSKQRAQTIKEFQTSTDRFLITNYDSMKRPSKTRRGNYDLFKETAKGITLVIFDECYEISNHTSNRFKDIRRVISPIQDRIIMDGEPTAEGIKKLFGQFLMLDDGETFGRDYWKFMETYFYQPPNLPFPKWVEKKGSSDRVAKILAERAFIFTEDDLNRELGLPDKVPYVVWPEMNPAQKKMITAIKKDWEVVVNGKVFEMSYVMEQISKVRQILDGFIYMDGEVVRIYSEKEKALTTMLKHQLAHKKKIVIFAAFRESLKVIGEVCDKLGRQNVLYYGGLTMSDRAFALNEFRDNPDIEVFVCQASCGVGLNELVVSNVAIYYSNTEKRRDRAQSEKRQIRPTQKADKSYVIDMVTPKSPEEKMYKRLQDKEDKSMLLLKWGDLK